jgi:hypothetical protein
MFDNGTIQMRGTSAASLGAGMALASLMALALGCEAQAEPSYEGEPLATVSGRVESALTLGEVEVGVLWLTTEASEGCARDFDIQCTGEASVANDAPSACVEACGEVTCQTLEAWGDCVTACPDVTNVWLDASPPGAPICITGGVGQTTPAVGEFPAQFSLDILEPPPAEALIGSASGERLAYGLFVALDPAGQPWRIDLTQPEPPDWLLGGSESHVLLYAPDGVPAGSTFAQALGFALQPGYQLMERYVSQGEEDGEPGEDDLVDIRPAPPGDASQVRLTIGAPQTIDWPLNL